MTPLMPLIQQMIIGGMVAKAAAPRFSSVTIILKILSSGLFMTGLVLILYAEYLWLDFFLPSYLSILIIAITLILLSTVLWFGAGKLKDTPSNQPPFDIPILLTEIFSLVDADLETAIRTNPKIAVALSTLIGFMAGKK